MIKRHRAYKVIRPSQKDKEELRNWKKVKKGKTSKKIRKSKKKISTPKTYTEYIKSDLWTNRRNRYWRNHKKLCATCNSPKLVHVHHIIYSNYDGNENDKNLIGLCENCHREFHEWFGSKQDMTDETDLFITLKSSFTDDLSKSLLRLYDDF